MISTQDEWRQPGTGVWWGGVEAMVFATDKGLAHTKNVRQYLKSKKIRANRASSKATRLFSMEQ
jgi:hypothetical protein